METFVVRVATGTAAKASAAGDLHGVVEQLRSKRSRAFRGTDELLRFLVEGVAAPDSPSVAGDTSDPAARLGLGR